MAEEMDETARRIARALDGWDLRLGRQYGPLSRPQRRVLRLIAELERARVGDIAARLDLTTAGATRMVDRLEEAGLARRERARAGEGDQREVRLVLTTTGAAALDVANQAYSAAVAERLAALAPADRLRLAELLESGLAPESDA